MTYDEWKAKRKIQNDYLGLVNYNGPDWPNAWNQKTSLKKMSVWEYKTNLTKVSDKIMKGLALSKRTKAYKKAKRLENVGITIITKFDNLRRD